MISLMLVAFLATIVTTAGLSSVEAKKFDDLAEDEKAEVLTLLSEVMEATQLSPARIIHAGLEKIHEDSMGGAQDEGLEAQQQQQQPESLASSFAYTHDGQSAPEVTAVTTGPQQHVKGTIPNPEVVAQTPADPTRPTVVSGDPEEEFVEDTYIDNSDPNNPREVHTRKRKRVDVTPNGMSRVHEESRSSQTINPNSPYKSRSSSSSSSYSSSSSSSNGKPVDVANFAGQPEIGWPKFPEIPPIPAMPPMPAMSMPLLPYGFPSADAAAWRGFYPLAGYPVVEGVPYVGAAPLSKRQAKKLARKAMWEAKRKAGVTGVQQAEQPTDA